MNTTVKFTLEGIMFSIPSKHVTDVQRWDGTPLEKPMIVMNHVVAAKVIKQYVKKKHPNVVVTTKSNSYSMGSSVNVYISDQYGNEVSTDIIADVNKFSRNFVYGSFNAMIDMYEHTEDGSILTKEGFVIEPSVKYILVQNRPKFMSVPSVVKIINDHMTGKYKGGNKSKEAAIETVRGYGATEATLKKALALLK